MTRVEELNWGSFGALCGLVCHVSTFRVVHCAFGFRQWITTSIEWDIYIYIYIFFFFNFFFYNGCLDSLVLSCLILSCHVHDLWSLTLIGCDEAQIVFSQKKKAQIVILSYHVLTTVLLVYNFIFIIYWLLVLILCALCT